jgi:hypothetical protein
MRLTKCEISRYTPIQNNGQNYGFVYFNFTWAELVEQMEDMRYEHKILVEITERKRELRRHRRRWNVDIEMDRECGQYSIGSA